MGANEDPDQTKGQKRTERLISQPCPSLNSAAKPQDLLQRIEVPSNTETDIPSHRYHTSKIIIVRTKK